MLTDHDSSVLSLSFDPRSSLLAVGTNHEYVNFYKQTNEVDQVEKEEDGVNKEEKAKEKKKR